ncbi:MAG: cytochrome ubiquinol oxidase subunit II [Gammaproteobacteria bacterium]
MPLLFLAGCSEVNDSFLDPKGPIAAAQKDHFISVFLYSMLAAGPVFLLVPIIFWRYRYKNKNARYTPNWEFSGLLDSLMWGVPVAIIFVLSGQLWHSSKTLDPYRPIESSQPALEVHVVGLDWKWLFIYPEQGIATIGELAFPADRPVSLRLTSDTVMQSFMISSLAGQIYTMPGMKTRQHIKADNPGVFEGQNTQFNGDGFATQKFNAVALTNEDFDAWIATVRADGVPLTDAAYNLLGNRSTKQEVHEALGTASMPENVTYFSSVVADLYENVVARYHTGEAIAPTEQPGGEFYLADPQTPAARVPSASIQGAQP